MDTTKEWFAEFKSQNRDKEELISVIEASLTEQNFNVNKFTNSLEKNVKSIEQNIFKEKFNLSWCPIF